MCVCVSLFSFLSSFNPTPKGRETKVCESISVGQRGAEGSRSEVFHRYRKKRHWSRQCLHTIRRHDYSDDVWNDEHENNAVSTLEVIFQSNCHRRFSFIRHRSPPVNGVGTKFGPIFHVFFYCICSEISRSRI